MIAHLIDAHPDFNPRAWLDALPPLDDFGVMIFNILGQQISVAASRSILGRLITTFGGHTPTPTELLAAEAELIRGAGLSRAKVATLRAVAEVFLDGSLDATVLQELSDDEVLARLTAIRGVGPWTAQGFLIFALDRQDVVLAGDLALRRVISRAYGLAALPSQDEVLTLAEAWRPHRTLATAYLFSSEFE